MKITCKILNALYCLLSETNGQQLGKETLKDDGSSLKQDETRTRASMSVGNYSLSFDELSDLNASSLITPINHKVDMNEFFEYRTAMMLLTWGLPVVILTGTVGNTLTFIVMMQREMKQTSTCFYIAALSIGDTGFLYLSALKTWIRTWSGFEMLHVSNGMCKTLTFLIYFSMHLSAWLIVAVTIERFIAIWYPLRASKFCSLRRAKISVTIIVLTFILFDSHLFLTAELTPDNMCNSYSYKNIICDMLPYLHLVIYSIVPFLILIIFNSLIIYSLVRHSKLTVLSMTKDDRQLRYNHRRLAITLLTVSFVWMFMTIPASLFTIALPPPHDMHSAAQLLLVKVIFYIFLYINHSINFFLYCFTGHRFRQELWKIICRKNKPIPIAKLIFKTSSGPESTYPLVNYPNQMGDNSSSRNQQECYHENKDS